MNIELIVIGKTNVDFVEIGIAEYKKRLSKYTKFNITTFPDIKGAKSMAVGEIKQREGEMLLSALKDFDEVVLLDERGKEFSSEGFATYIENLNLRSVRNIAFVIGGAYGFSEQVYSRCTSKISLSKMTFSHQMIRLIFIEQLYRAHTIIKGEPYHHK
ncbi:MAG: 23S rRNA (pseudouridine(1915)-N(3))-methyltransferase RlmH [Rikenellaceae bacterium]